MWDNKMKEYEQRAGELLEAMRQVRAGARANPSPDPGPGALTVPQPASLALDPTQRHVLDLREFHKKKEEGTAIRPKHSKDLLDLRKIQVSTVPGRGEAWG